MFSSQTEVVRLKAKQKAAKKDESKVPEEPEVQSSVDEASETSGQSSDAVQQLDSLSRLMPQY